MGWQDKGRPADANGWHGRRFRGYRYFRCPRLMNDRREIETSGWPPRTKRRTLLRLLAPWDELLRGDRRHRSWKRHRPHQYCPATSA